MLNRQSKLVAAVVGVIVVLATATACSAKSSSSVAGPSGAVLTSTGVNSASSTATTSAKAQPATTVTVTEHAEPTASSSRSSSHPSSSKSHATSASTTTTPSVSASVDTSPAQVDVPLVGTITARSYCKSHSDPDGTAQFAWTSTGTNQVWILEGPRAISNGDARAAGGRGPYPYNGSATLPFDCSGANDSFRFSGYRNDAGDGLTGTLFVVQYNA